MAPQTMTRLTYEDYLELPDDGKQYELIEGELIVNPAPIPRHQILAMRISARLFVHVEEHRLGMVIAAPIDVVLSDDVVLQPDVLFVSTERMSIIDAKNLRGAPSLVIEVLSDRTRRRDEIIKRRLYERFGVDEYWIVDPELETVKIYRSEAGAFVRVAELSNEIPGTITSPLLPGFQLDLAVIFDL